MDSLLRTSYTLPTFDPPNTTLEDLLNTGKIEIIQNETLRNLLSSWNGKLAESKRQEQHQGDFLYKRFTPYIEDNIEFNYQGDFIGKNSPKTEFFGQDPRTLLQDFRFCNLTKRAYYWNWWVKKEYLNLEKEIDEIIGLTAENK